MSFWFSWPRFGYKCALIAIPVAGRAEQSRAGQGRHLAQWVRWFVSWDTIAQVPVVGLETCATTRRMDGKRREGKGRLFECCYFVCRLLCVLLRLCGCLLLLYTLDMLYICISISLSPLCLSHCSSFARLPAQEHPKAKFSLASAKSSELNVSIDSKRHCLNTHTHKHCATRFLPRRTKAKGEMGLRSDKCSYNALN